MPPIDIWGSNLGGSTIEPFFPDTLRDFKYLHSKFYLVNFLVVYRNKKPPSENVKLDEKKKKNNKLLTLKLVKVLFFE